MSGGHAVPAANTNMHCAWNSKNPKSSSMEFHRAGGRQINQGGREAANHKHQHNEDRKRRGHREGGGGLKITALRPLGCLPPLQPLWQFVRYSTLPKMAATSGFSCRTLVWELSRRLTQRSVCSARAHRSEH